MNNVGFLGGPTLNELGPASDVQFFFDCMADFVVAAEPMRDWTLVTDRLYRRYLRLEELGPAQALMEVTKSAFAGVASANASWSRRAVARSRLNAERSNLADVFSAYFAAFDQCRRASELTEQRWGSYRPLRLVISDLPDLLVEKARPLEDYDALEGEPFWSR